MVSTTQAAALCKLLGVPTNATSYEIRRAYRRLARSAHPDRGGDPAEFIKIQGAYEALTNDSTGSAAAGLPFEPSCHFKLLLFSGTADQPPQDVRRWCTTMSVGEADFVQEEQYKRAPPKPRRDGCSILKCTPAEIRKMVADWGRESLVDCAGATAEEQIGTITSMCLGGSTDSENPFADLFREKGPSEVDMVVARCASAVRVASFVEQTRIPLSSEISGRGWSPVARSSVHTSL